MQSDHASIAIEGIPKVDEMVETPTGSTMDADKGTEPQCHGEEEDTAIDVGLKVLEGKGADHASSSNSSESKDEVPRQEALIHKIIREARGLLRRERHLRLVLRTNLKAHLSPMSNDRGMMPEILTTVIESPYPLRTCSRK